jgi:hypothetical protein
MAEEAVVLRDNEGNYYVLPKPTVEGTRVPPELVRQLEEALASDEVTGHAMRWRYQVVGTVGIGPPGGIRAMPHGDK